MNDLIPLAIFVGCLLATFGLVRVCEWLRPDATTQRTDHAASSAATARHEEAAQ